MAKSQYISHSLSKIRICCTILHFNIDFSILLLQSLKVDKQDTACFGIRETLHSVSSLFYLDENFHRFSLQVNVEFICLLLYFHVNYPVLLSNF